MKNFLSFLFAFFILNLVLNCSATQPNNPHYQREWMLISFDAFTKQQLIEKSAGINLTGEKIKNQVKGSATMGCNKIFFNAEIKNKGKIKISNLGSTEMACQNRSIEDRFMKKFGNMSHYKIEGHRMTLSDKNGNEMKFIAADWD